MVFYSFKQFNPIGYWFFKKKKRQNQNQTAKKKLNTFDFSKMISTSFFLLSLLLVQMGHAIKFTELSGRNLNGTTVSFQKYADKCVLVLQISPLILRPKIQVTELNKLHNKYHKRGKF